jgi:hypothetical protein
MIANQDSMIAEGEYEEVEEGVHAGSRYSSFLNKRKSKSWGIEETRLFYKVRGLRRASLPHCQCPPHLTLLDPPLSLSLTLLLSPLLSL